MNILILETSTTSAKAMLYHVEKDSYELDIKPLSSFSNEATLHDTKSVFEQTMALGKKLCRGKEIDVISLVTTWHSLVLCDGTYEPLTPTYLWSNQAASNLSHVLKQDVDYARNYYKRTGCVVSGTYPFFKLKEQTLLKNKKILDQGSYTMHRLTESCVILESMASGTGWFNVKRREYDEELLNEVGISISQLPYVVSSDKTFPLSQEGAKLLGLKAGIPVIAPGPDGAFNQIGSDGLKEGVMTLSVGTSGALRCFSNHPKLSPRQSTWCYALENGWLVGAATSGACNCVDYMKEKLFDSKVTFGEIETAIEQIVLSETDLIFMPFIFGERSPGWKNNRYGGFLANVKKNITYTDIEAESFIKYLSTLEGILFNLYQCYLEVVEITDEPTTIKLSGGILHSDYWSQMCADIFGKVMECDEIQHASLVGGRVLAQKALGLVEKPSDNQKNTDEKGIESQSHRIYPDRIRHKLYQKRFKKYLEFYNAKE